MLLRNLARRLRAESGFSMVVTMGVMSMMLLTAAASMEALRGDQPSARDDRNRKVAFAAAEAGLQVYVHKLMDSADYWTQCAVPADGVNQVWNLPDPDDPRDTTGNTYRNATKNDPRTWKELPDGTAAYTIESLPANGEAACDSSRPEATMIDTPTATFRIRVTGQAIQAAGRTGAPRSLIATFKRKSFLDFIYFTDLEVTDPSTYNSYPALNYPTLEDPGRNPWNTGRRTVEQWGQDACGVDQDGNHMYAYVRGKNGEFREDQLFYGRDRNSAGRRVNGFWNTWQAECREIQFVTGDVVNGPLHTNDSLLICGSPSFGRSPGDAVETSAPTSGGGASGSYRQAASCGASAPDVNYEGQAVRNNRRGTWRYDQPRLDLPKDNRALAEEAPDDYTFMGETTIVLGSGGLTVTGRTKAGRVLNNARIPYPTNGVLYVANRTDASQGALCTAGYQVADPYANRSGCGIANVSGTYDTPLTIGAEDDIVIRGNVRLASRSTALLGLIANAFIRIYHPIVGGYPCDSADRDGPGSLVDPHIDAALLTLKHSFMVDNYMCGSPLGDLTVNGAISQQFRGPVGTGTRGAAATGYIKEYIYDDRLAVRSPPNFLDPIQAAWRIKTFQEQVPAQGEVRR